MTDLVLFKIDKARLLLAEAKTVQEAKQIADVAEAARVYAKRVEASIITVNHAAEIKIRAERLLGEMLAQTPKNSGARGVGKSGVPQKNPTFKAAGVSKKQSARSQKLAKIPAPVFEHALAERREAGKEITTAGILRIDGTAAKKSAGDSDEVCWRRGLLYRANESTGNAAFEDWSHFKVDLQLIRAATRAAEVWKALAVYLTQLHHDQKKTHARAA